MDNICADFYLKADAKICVDFQLKYHGGSVLRIIERWG